MCTYSVYFIPFNLDNIIKRSYRNDDDFDFICVLIMIISL